MQGGFAGAGVVPEDRQLEKFRGLVTCPSYNLNGDVKSALAVIAADGIGRKRFVSKNVCHGVVYDRALHAEVAAVRHGARSLELIWQGMDAYLHGRTVPGAEHRESADPRGKMLHDPLAACCAIDPSIAQWAEVELYRERGAWGSRPAATGDGVLITVGYDHPRFLATLLES